MRKRVGEARLFSQVVRKKKKRRKNTIPFANGKIGKMLRLERFPTSERRILKQFICLSFLVNVVISMLVVSNIIYIPFRISIISIVECFADVGILVVSQIALIVCFIYPSLRVVYFEIQIICWYLIILLRSIGEEFFFHGEINIFFVLLQVVSFYFILSSWVSFFNNTILFASVILMSLAGVVRESVRGINLGILDGWKYCIGSSIVYLGIILLILEITVFLPMKEKKLEKHYNDIEKFSRDVICLKEDYISKLFEKKLSDLDRVERMLRHTARIYLFDRKFLPTEFKYKITHSTKRSSTHATSSTEIVENVNSEKSILSQGKTPFEEKYILIVVIYFETEIENKDTFRLYHRMNILFKIVSKLSLSGNDCHSSVFFHRMMGNKLICSVKSMKGEINAELKALRFLFEVKKQYESMCEHSLKNKIRSCILSTKGVVGFFVTDLISQYIFFGMDWELIFYLVNYARKIDVFCVFDDEVKNSLLGQLKVRLYKIDEIEYKGRDKEIFSIIDMVMRPIIFKEKSLKKKVVYQLEYENPFVEDSLDMTMELWKNIEDKQRDEAMNCIEELEEYLPEQLISYYRNYVIYGRSYWSSTTFFEHPDPPIEREVDENIFDT